MRSLDLTPLFRSSIGFDQLDKMFDSAFREASRDNSYPPYNIVKIGEDRYQITMAVAGFGEDDVDITAHHNVLIIKGQTEPADKTIEFLHRGIAQRAFEHRFQLADHVKVRGADMEKGLLHIHLEREVPETLKPRKISIGAGKGRQPVIDQPDQKSDDNTVKIA